MKQVDKFTGKVVFVTGAASGIGQAQASAFLDAGARVFGVDIKQPAQLSKEYSSFQSYTGDLSQEVQCKKAVQQCLQHFGRIDILLNTAGVLDDYATLLETDSGLWRHILSSNLDSMFFLSKAILPEMLSLGSGVIINMASIAGLVAGGGGIAYTTSKHAIIGFTKQLALDYGEKNIHVKAIAPGAIKTPMNAKDFEGTASMATWVADETPMKRWATPEEVAELTLFLASPAANYMQGAVVPIDGGWTLK